MRINIHKATAAFAVVVLVVAVIWWIRFRKREVIKPVERKLMDSITYHMNEARKHADIARTYGDEAEKYAEVYNNPRIDSAKRARIGSEIYANAVRKADSLRECATR